MSEGRGRGGWKRPLLFVLATAPIGLAVFSFVFMARSELAFDEARCPYREDGAERVIRPGLVVREDVRRCQDGVEEHRWVLMREGRAAQEIGRRRLESRFFAGAYRWTAEEELVVPDGGTEGELLVRLRIYNPGLDRRSFREPSADAGTR